MHKQVGKIYKRVYAEKIRNDERTADAVVRNLEIIGEAAKNISVDVRKKSPDIPWKKIVGFRNIVSTNTFA